MDDFHRRPVFMCQEGQFPAEEAVALGGGGRGVNCGAGRGGR